jgi:3-oxoacyl-[acyl-carrier protein] reductase
MAVDGLSAYCAAKAGVSQLTKVVAGEAGRYGIRCNSIAPGLTITEMTKRFAEGPAGKPFYERTPMFEHSSRARAAEPEDLAKSVVFFSSNYATWITGVTLSIDGGCHIRGLHSYMDADYFAEHGKMPVVEW